MEKSRSWDKRSRRHTRCEGTWSEGRVVGWWGMEERWKSEQDLRTREHDVSGVLQGSGHGGCAR